MPKARTYAHLTAQTPPSCVAVDPQQWCGGATVDACQCKATKFYRAPRAPPSGFDDAALLRPQRVFFLDGHSGPMNDMINTLVDSFGVRPEAIEGMLFAQAEQKRMFIDVLNQRVTKSGTEKCKGRLLGKRVSLALHHWMQGKAFTRSAVSSSTPCMLLNNCERKRCRDALVSDGLRREFANRYDRGF